MDLFCEVAVYFAPGAMDPRDPNVLLGCLANARDQLRTVESDTILELLSPIHRGLYTQDDSSGVPGSVF